MSCYDARAGRVAEEFLRKRMTTRGARRAA